MIPTLKFTVNKAGLTLFFILFLGISYGQNFILPDSLCGTWQLDSIKMEKRPAVSASQLGGEVTMRFLSNGMLIVQRYDAKDAYHTITFDGKIIALKEDRKEMEVIAFNRKFLSLKGKENGQVLVAVYRKKTGG